MSLKSNKLLRTIQKNANDNEANTRLATIRYDSVNRKYVIRFYGEEADSQKTYKMLSSVSINVSKPVLLQKINGTYVIMGNVG